MRPGHYRIGWPARATDLRRHRLPTRIATSPAAARIDPPASRRSPSRRRIRRNARPSTRSSGRSGPRAPAMFPLRRFRIEDESMRPTLEPGDYVLVNRWAYRVRPPRRGDLVVVRDPELSDRFLVKRVSETQASTQIPLEGDNAAVSRDSRAFGAVPLDRIVGKVWLRLKP